MTITPQLMQIYRALADKGFRNRAPKEQERIIAHALRAADFVPPGEELSLHEMAEDAGIDLQAAKNHSGFARAQATADRIGFGTRATPGETVDRGTWVKGTLPSSHRWQARVFQRATVYGIPEAPRIEDLLIMDPRGVPIVEYARGWDTKPKSGDIAVYQAATTAAIGAVKSRNARAGARARFGQYDEEFRYLQYQSMNQPALAKKNLLVLARKLGADVHSSTADADRLAALAVKLRMESEMWKAYDGPMPHARTGGKDSFAFSKDLARQLRAVRSDIASQQANLRADDKEGHWSNRYSRCVALSALYGNGGGGLASIYRELMNTKATGREETNGGNYSRAGGKALMGSMPRTQEEMWKALTDPNFRSLAPWRRQGLLRQARTTSWWRPPGAEMNMGELADTLDGGPGFNPRPIVRARDDHARPGPRGPAVEIDRDSIQRWEDQNQKRLTSAGRSAWVFDDPSGKAIMVPGSNTYAEAVAWLKKNALTSGTYKLCMQRPESSAVARRLGAFARGDDADEFKPGDSVHAGLRVRGGAGYTGRITKIDGAWALIEVPGYKADRSDTTIVRALVRNLIRHSRAGARDRFAEQKRGIIPNESLNKLRDLIRETENKGARATTPDDKTMYFDEAHQYEAIIRHVRRNDPEEAGVVLDGMGPRAIDRIPRAILQWCGYAT